MTTTPVFISWSKDRSKAVAKALSEWLPCVLQAVDPWCSLDTDAGARWSGEIASRLSTCKLGILCVTPDNLHSDWLLFEAGALAKTMGDDTRVIPYLVDLTTSDVQPPLSQLQMKLADREGTFDVVKTLNKQIPSPLKDTVLEKTFDRFWPELAASLAAIPKSKAPTKQERTERELLEEVLATVREIARRPTVEEGATVSTQRDLFRLAYRNKLLEQRRETARNEFIQAEKEFDQLVARGESVEEAGQKLLRARASLDAVEDEYRNLAAHPLIMKLNGVVSG